MSGIVILRANLAGDVDKNEARWKNIDGTSMKSVDTVIIMCVLNTISLTQGF